MNYIYAASGSLIIFFIVLILKKQKKTTADYLLIGINVLIGSFMLADVLVNWRMTSLTIIFQNGLPLFLFPVFVFYVLEFIYANKQKSAWWALLFLPGLLFLCWSILDHFVLKNYPGQVELDAHFNQPSLLYQFFFKGSQLLFIGVMTWLLFALNNFGKELKSGYSSIETIDVRWLKHFTWIYLLSVAITFIMFLSQNLGLLSLEIKEVFGIIYAGLVASVFYLNYHGIQHYTLSQFDPTSHSINQTEPIKKPQTLKSIDHLSEEEKLIEQDILQLIELEKLYLQSKISLHELASRLGKSRHLISRIINAKEGRTFYDLINGYRVKHLKGLLDDPTNAHLTILSMGLDSGFNSKASLNRIFKNITGLTPRQYLNQRSQ